MARKQVILFDSAQQSCSASRSNFSSLSKWATLLQGNPFEQKTGLRNKSDKLLGSPF